MELTFRLRDSNFAHAGFAKIERGQLWYHMAVWAAGCWPVYIRYDDLTESDRTLVHGCSLHAHVTQIDGCGVYEGDELDGKCPLDPTFDRPVQKRACLIPGINYGIGKGEWNSLWDIRPSRKEETP